MRRYKLIIEYDGTNFIGWQKQKRVFNSRNYRVQQKKFLQEDVTLIVAGRTDAGVHAKGQVAHIDIKKLKN